MKWHELHSLEILDKCHQESFSQKVLLFKHSTRCSISSMALGRLECAWNLSDDVCKPYLLDLISFREVSHAIADQYLVTHESPQILLIQDGECILDASHQDIHFAEIESMISK